MRVLTILLILSLFCSSVRCDTIIELSPFTVVAPHLSAPEVFVQSDAVRRAKPVDLAEVLSLKIPDVALSRRGPLAGDIVLRGLSRDNILITVDGAKTYCACPNRMDPPAFHVSSQQIEAISIRKGPFHVDQGATVGGAVLVQTARAATGNSLDTYAFVGDFNYIAGGLSAGISRGDGALGTNLGLYYQSGDVYKDGEGDLFTQLPGTNFRPEYQDSRSFEMRSADFQGTWRLERGAALSLIYGYQDAIDVLYPGLKMDALGDTMNRGSIGLTLPVKSSLADDVEYRIAFSTIDHDMQDRFRTSSQMNPSFAERGYMMRTVSETAFHGLTVRARLKGNAYALRYGLSAADRYWDADNVVMMERNNMLPDVRTRAFGAWGVYEYRHEAVACEIGARLDSSSSEARQSIQFIHDSLGTDTNKVRDLLPSAYVLFEWKPDPAIGLYAGLGHAARVPDPQERYMNLNRPGSNPDWIGNPDLDPVQNTELQAGINGSWGATHASLSVFHAWLNDYTYLAALHNGTQTATTYTGINARLYGASADFSCRIREGVTLEGGLAWQEGLKQSDPDRYTHEVLGEIPPMRGRLAADWKTGAWNLRLETLYQADFDRLDPELKEVPLDGWIVWNLSAAWMLSDRLTLSGGIDNLLDQHYSVANGYVRDPFRSGVIVYEQGRFLFGRVTCSW